MLNSMQNRLARSLLLPGVIFSATLVSAQQIATPAVAPGKSFDVVSIRQNISPTGPNTLQLSPGPTGFQITHMPLELVLMTAYVPKAGGMFLNNIENRPDWVHNDRYDIDARISDADRAAWNDPKNQPAMLQQMLQTMLADRFKLAVHRGSKEVSVEEMVIAKGGPKLTERKPDEPIPAGRVLPDGGVIVPGQNGPRLYNFSMSTFATALSEGFDRPIVDKTGLTGRYDIDMPNPERIAHAAGTDNGQVDPEAERIEMIRSLGLKLQPAKEQVETLIIDHIEKPTEN